MVVLNNHDVDSNIDSDCDNGEDNNLYTTLSKLMNDLKKRCFIFFSTLVLFCLPFHCHPRMMLEQRGHFGGCGAVGHSFLALPQR
jgi:hypothetical protein